MSMRPLKVGVYSTSSHGSGMMGKPMSAVRQRFEGTTAISSQHAGQKGRMKNKVRGYSGDVSRRKSSQ